MNGESTLVEGTNPLRASFYADHALHQEVVVEENVQLARGTFRVRFACPSIAERIVPGQFLMVRLAVPNDPLLARPLALYDTVLDGAGRPIGLDVVYLVMGKMTRLLAGAKPGDRLVIWGPLGNGFSAAPVEHLVMVAGGIGQTPFLALGQEFLGSRRYGSTRNVSPSRKVTLCYGVRTDAYLAGVADFERAGFDVRISSDDGSVGHHGFVTDLLGRVLTESRGEDRRVVCCGPEPMMEAVADLCALSEVPCHVSLETPMACGIGICFSCVARVRQADGEWDYKRTCVEGPVFEAQSIVW